MLGSCPPHTHPCDSPSRPLHRSEIMTSGWCGGDWVGWQSCCPRPKARAAWSGSPDKSLSRGVAPCRCHRGLEAAKAWAAGGVVRGGPHWAADGFTYRSRDAARDSPGSACHKPKIPIGRRGVSLNFLRTTARGKGLAGPSLHLLGSRGWFFDKTPKPEGLSDASARPTHRALGPTPSELR